MLTIRPLEHGDAPKLASLHLTYLRSNLRGYPARKLLSLYYQYISHGNGACGYVADKDGTTVGYVCGIWDKRALRSAIIHKGWFKLLIWGLCEIAINPRLLLKAVRPLLSFRQQPRQTEWPFELRPIVVASEARGSGAAKILVDTLAQDARTQGFDVINLITEADNIIAQRFYEKMGFSRTEDISIFGDSYFCYELRICG